MRPVDADELRAWLIRAGQFLKAQDDKRSAAHAIGKIIEHVDNMPTVPAITIDWLDAQIRGYASALKSTELKALLIVKKLWEQEQEAR